MIELYLKMIVRGSAVVLYWREEQWSDIESAGLRAAHSSSVGPSPSQNLCVVFLGKTLYSHSVSLGPDVSNDTGECKSAR